MFNKGLSKGILSLGLCGALLSSPITSFAAEENNFSIQPNIIYTEFGYTDVESEEQPVIGSDNLEKDATPISTKSYAPRKGQCFDNIEGGKWCKGQVMGWKLDRAQYSHYEHNSRTHKASAMANGVTRKGDWVKAGTPAYKESYYYKTLNTYKSYYDVK
ncbi:lactococcin 972 family bacteriocin [Bacillus fungorum]|uniref:lactococcin 972 family bacteriocin n=1 Tax=Bacillus fungorum TaxID=2039284 RepID=UPI003399537B